jgi:hypothetical protein
LNPEAVEMRKRLCEAFSRPGSDSFKFIWYGIPGDKEHHNQQTQQKTHARSPGL